MCFLRKYSIILALCWLPLNASLASMCSDSEIIKISMDKEDYRTALQEMDKCLAVSKQSEAYDLDFFNDLIKQILTADDFSSSEDVYRNFQSVLKIHLLKGLKFQFAEYFKTHTTDNDELFAKVQKTDEKYYFYHDTGRMLSYSRGIALTDKSLIWKNIIGEQQRLAFDDIKSMTLIYELGLSLTGWKLKVNNNENHEIRLSSVPDNGVIPLVSAMIYFINFHKTSPDKTMVSLELPEREKGILAGWVTMCSDKHVNQGDPIKKLQLLDACFTSYGSSFKLSQSDRELSNKLTAHIFEKSSSEFAEMYNNFKVVLSTHFFRDLKFKFRNNFDAQIQADADYYFYFDMGIIGSRGMALTNNSIRWKNLLASSISWKNLTGSFKELPYKEISSVTLVHEVGIDAINGWKFRFNKDKNYEIVLSGLNEDNVELFASAVIYFINMVSGVNLTLQVPEETRDALNKNFLERHPKIKSMTDSVFEMLDDLKPSK